MTASTEIAKSMGGLNALEEAQGHLGAALMQSAACPDEIILGHIRSAHQLLQVVTRVQRAIQSSDGGVESRHATTGNKSGATPEAEQCSSATSFVREIGPEDKTLKPRAGVAPCPSEAIDLPSFLTSGGAK